MERYRASFQAVSEALDRVGPQRIDHAPAGAWSPRQIVHHLADTELFRGARLRVLLSEDEPRIPALDERRFASSLHYDRDVASSLTLLAAVMDTNLELLDCLDEEEWRRAGVHEEFGEFSVEAWLERAAGHAHDHANQILSVLEAQ